MKSRKQINRTFFAKVALLVFIVVSIDQLAGVVLYHLFKRQNTGEFAVANHVAYNFNEDILVLGSSRATHHYNPAYIKDAFKLSCYNGGRNGEGILYSTAMMELAFRHHIPKCVILDVESGSLDKNKDGKDKLSILLPYLKESDTIKNIIKEKSSFELYKGFMQTYRYNGLVLSILQHNFLPSISSNFVMGFKPLTTTMDGGKYLPKPYKPYADIIDTDYVNALNSIIETCKQKHVQLFVFISPRYNDDTKSNSYLKIQSICKANNVPFHDFTNNPFFKHPQYYSDKAHLNGVGANLYTDTVISFIKKNLKNEAYDVLDNKKMKQGQLVSQLPKF